jgi:hypothetical protein
MTSNHGQKRDMPYGQPHTCAYFTYMLIRTTSSLGQVRSEGLADHLGVHVVRLARVAAVGAG